MNFKRLNENPCKECGDRHVGCHSSCSKYAEWRAAADADNAAIKAKKEELYTYISLEKYMAEKRPPQHLWKKK